ncbi:MAG: hypothetical protein ACI89L_001654 [Phycisphaerales bacterium]|jgi:hypothetical protein
MRAFQIVLGLVAVGIAGGLASGQSGSVMGAERSLVLNSKAPAIDPARGTTAGGAVTKTADADYDPMTDPVVTQRIIDLIESGQRNKAIALIEQISSGGGLELLDPCNVGGWKLEKAIFAGDGFLFMALDLEGNLIVSGREGGVATVWKYKTSNGINLTTGVEQAPNGPEGGAEWKASFAGYEAAVHVVVDNDGFIYQLLRKPGLVEYALVKLTPNGGTIWSSTVFAPSNFDIESDLDVGPDGVPVLTTKLGVTQFNPYTGGVEWFYNDRLVTANQVWATTIDRTGDVYIGTSNGSLVRLSGASGREAWAEPVQMGALVGGGAFRLNDIFTDGSDNVVMAMRSADLGSAVAMKFTSDGDPVWGTPWQGQAPAQPQLHVSAAMDRNGNLFLLGYNGFDQPMVTMLSSNGQYQWQHTYTPSPALATGGTFDSRSEITTDRAGNAYFSVNYTGNQWIARIDPTLPSAPECQWSDFSSKAHAVDIVVDGGGSIFTTRFDFQAPNQAVIRKISQLVDLPLEFTASPFLTVKDRSVWPGNLGRVEDSLSIFDESWNEGILIGGFIDPWPIDETGAALAFATSGRIQTGFKAEIEGGTVDIDFPIDVLWETSGDAIPATLPVNFDISWTVDPAASLTSCSKPEFNAGITAGLNMNVFSNLSVKVFGGSLLNEDLLDLMVDLPNGYIMSLGAFNDLLGLLPEGTYVKVPGTPTGVTIKLRKPVLSAQSGITAMDPASNNASFASSAKNSVAIFDFSVTNFILDRYVKGRPDLCPQPQDNTPVGKINKEICDLSRKIYTLNQKAGFSVGELGLAYRLQLLNLIIRAEFAAKQDLGAKITPMVRYEVRDGSGVLRTGPWETAVPLDMAPNFGDIDLTVPMSNDGVLEVTPFVSATAEFDNNTGASITPGLRWETLLAKLRASAFGITIVPPFDLCLLCDDLEFFELDIPLYDEAPFVMNFPEIALPPMRVVGIQAGGEGPKLASASRTALPMVIYDQTSPSISSFNNGANGVSKMLLYGERFELPFEASVVPVVKISHYGRTEVLASTRLNANTILCEVPNRFRLLPGVARIWVERDHLGVTQSTGTLDMPIEYPVPRLDAVNPNLWAADPDMYVVPMQVIDRKTLLGTDTFITRRDYYVRMRGQLWNASSTADLAGVNLVVDADGSGLVDIDEVFPGFDFDAPPAFPTVLFGTQDEFGTVTMNPLPIFIQPIDSGIHNVRLAERNYNRPGYIPVLICNPGPGGGMSETLMLDIAAPIPVASELEPSEVEPGGSLLEGQFELELIVRGPVHVPTWDAFEEPKFGNFNADSEVLFDGVPVPTRFVDSSELRAFVPDYMLQVAGTAVVTVFTPANGSMYLEKKWSDPDGDGVFDSPVLAEIPSGGESVPLFFPIRFRQPVISEVFPPETVVGNTAYEGTSAGYPHFNVVISGNNFRDGAVVMVDGAPRETRYVDRETLSVRVLPEDIARVGRRFISVLNPGRDGHVSEMAEFFVTTPKAAAFTRMGP